MIRAKTYKDAKTQASGNPELLWWVFMRISGLVLVFLVFGHIYMTFIAVSDIASSEYDVVVAKLSQPIWKFYNWLILVLAGLHGLNGARYSMEDYIPNKVTRAWVKGTVYSVAGTMFLWGSVGLFTAFNGPA